MGRTRAVSVAAVAAVALVALSGCSLLAELFGQGPKTPQETHELQRQTAINFKRDWPATESIRFTQDGSVSGAGTWSATPTSGSLTVHYSNGTSEVIE